MKLPKAHWKVRRYVQGKPSSAPVIKKLKQNDLVLITFSHGRTMRLALEHNRLVIHASEGILKIIPHTANTLFAETAKLRRK